MKKKEPRNTAKHKQKTGDKTTYQPKTKVDTPIKMNGVVLFAVGSADTRPFGIGNSTQGKVTTITPVQFEDENMAKQIKEISMSQSLGYHFIIIAK